MQEIKFRGKEIETDDWIYGSLLILNDKYYIHPSNYGDLDDIDFGWGFYEVYKDSVGQYINLKDKNGKEIYEGDKDKKYGIIVYLNSEFVFEDQDGWTAPNGIEDIDITGACL